MVTVKWDAEAGMHFYWCGPQKQYVCLKDPDGNEVIPLDGGAVDSGSDTNTKPASSAGKDEKTE